MAAITEPIIAPSHVFLGLTLGASLCLPNNDPPKKAKISQAHTPIKIIKMDDHS
jgi:hypothetical protein